MEILMKGRPFHSIIDTVSEESKEVPRIRGQNKNSLLVIFEIIILTYNKFGKI